MALAAAAAIFGAAPDHPQPLAQIIGVIGAIDLDRRRAIADFDPLDGRVGGNLDGQRGVAIAGFDDVAHHHLVDRPARGVGKQIGVAVEQGRAAGEMGAHVQMHAAPGGAVVMAPTQTVEQAVTAQLIGQKTRQPAIGPETGGAGVAGPGSALVAIAVAHHA